MMMLIVQANVAATYVTLENQVELIDMQFLTHPTKSRRTNANE